MAESARTETLGPFLQRLIAEHEGIPVEAVTVAYIHEQRERRFYPNALYWDPVDSSLMAISRNQFEAAERELDELVASL